MNLKIEANGNKTTVFLEGRLDTTTAPQLDAELTPKLESVTELTLDFTDLAYISSAGLRILLMYQKKMNMCDGKMTVKNPNELVTEVFDATGFSDILNIIQE